MTCFSEYASPVEQRIAVRLITDALAAGCTVSVYDGEEWALKRCADLATIRDALAATDSDLLRLRDAADPARVVGSVRLIWGNGADLISDTSESDELAAILKGAERVADR